MEFALFLPRARALLDQGHCPTSVQFPSVYTELGKKACPNETLKHFIFFCLI